MINTWWKFLLVKNLCNLNSIKTIFLFLPCILILNPDDATRRCGDENHIAYIGIGGKEEDRTKTANVTERRRNQPSSFQFSVTRSLERISAIRSPRSNAAAAIFLFSSSNQPHRYGNHRVCSCCRVPRSLIACGNINLHGPWAGFASMRAGNDALPDGF